jgi:hypothetical protein
MSRKKRFLVARVNRKKGFFFFEFLTGIFLLSLCLSTVWGGLSYALKNYEYGSNLYQELITISEFLESDKNYDALKPKLKEGSIEETIKFVSLESSGITFKINAITISSLDNNNSEKIEVWEYSGKE